MLFKNMAAHPLKGLNSEKMRPFSEFAGVSIITYNANKCKGFHITDFLVEKKFECS